MQSALPCNSAVYKLIWQEMFGRAFAALLAGTPLRALLSVDFETLAWRKLLINAIANPITAHSPAAGCSQTR